MKAINSFKLDGVIGYVFADGFVKWHTISCHVESLADCELKTKALKALNK